MAQATSGEKVITIDGEKYKVRTQVVYQSGLGVQGTLSTTAPIRYVVQYLPDSSTSNPVPVWTNLGERDTTNKNNWIFTNAAGAGFQKALIANGPNSLTTSLDDATTNALSKSAGVTKQQATQILQVAPNLAPVAPGAVQPTPGGAAPTPPDDVQMRDAIRNATTPISLPSVGTAKGSQRTFGNLCYPVDLRDNRQDRIKFSMIEYAPASINPNLGQQTITRKFSKDTLGSVTLPIQPSINDSNTVDWSGATLNAVQAKAAGASLELMRQNNFRLFGQVGGQLLQTAMEEFAKTGSYSQALQIYLAQEAVGAQNLLSRASGSILNPNLELLFNGPSLRPFAFTFRLSPRDENEAKEVKKIIRFFKQGMAVKRTVEDVFLKAPNVFRIAYTTFEGEKEVPHPAINRFKECALLSCDVDYTPDGTYMTYVDKTMTSYQISLRFSELEPIYESDYQNLDNLAYNQQGEITNKGNLDSGGIGY